MVAVELVRADLALLSDLTQRVTFPSLPSLTETRTYAGISVRFAGDALPTPFRGEGRGRTFDLACRYTTKKQQQLTDLLALLDLAADSPDSRLLLRTHYGQVAGLDDALAVVVYAVTTDPKPGLHIDVTLSCEAVAFTLAV